MEVEDQQNAAELDAALEPATLLSPLPSPAQLPGRPPGTAHLTQLFGALGVNERELALLPHFELLSKRALACCCYELQQIITVHLRSPILNVMPTDATWSNACFVARLPGLANLRVQGEVFLPDIQVAQIRVLPRLKLGTIGAPAALFVGAIIANCDCQLRLSDGAVREFATLRTKVSEFAAPKNSSPADLAALLGPLSLNPGYARALRISISGVSSSVRISIGEDIITDQHTLAPLWLQAAYRSAGVKRAPHPALDKTYCRAMLSVAAKAAGLGPANVMQFERVGANTMAAAFSLHYMGRENNGSAASLTAPAIHSGRASATFRFDCKANFVALGVFPADMSLNQSDSADESYRSCLLQQRHWGSVNVRTGCDGVVSDWVNLEPLPWEMGDTVQIDVVLPRGEEAAQVTFSYKGRVDNATLPSVPPGGLSFGVVLTKHTPAVTLLASSVAPGG